MGTKSLASVSSEDEDLGSKLGRKHPFTVGSGRFGEQCPEKEVVLLKGQFEFLCFIVVKMFYGNRRSLLLLWGNFDRHINSPEYL